MGPVVKDGKATEEEISQSPPLKRLQPDFRDEAEGYIGNRRYAFLGSKDYVSSSDDDDDNDDDDDDDDDDNDDDDDDDYYRYCSNDEEREYERELRCHIEKIISTNGYEFEYNPRLTTIGGFTTLDVDGEDVSGFLGWSYELAKFAIDQHNSKPEIMALVAKDKLAFDKLLIANVGASGMDFRLTFTAIKEKSGDRVTCQAALCPMFMKDPELWQLRLKPSDGA